MGKSGSRERGFERGAKEQRAEFGPTIEELNQFVQSQIEKTSQDNGRFRHELKELVPDHLTTTQEAAFEQLDEQADAVLVGSQEALEKIQVELTEESRPKIEQANDKLNKINQASNFPELYQVISEIGQIPGKEAGVSAAGDWQEIIEAIRRGEKNIEIVTNRYGLRSKVAELLSEEDKKIAVETKPEKPTPTRIELRNQQERNFANFFAMHWESALTRLNKDASEEELDNLYRKVFDWAIANFNDPSGYKTKTSGESTKRFIDQVRAENIAAMVSRDLESEWRGKFIKVDIGDEELIAKSETLPAEILDQNVEEVIESQDSLLADDKVIAIAESVIESNEVEEIEQPWLKSAKEDASRADEQAEIVAQVQEELENLSPEEQQEVRAGLLDLGFIAKEKKSKFLAGLYNKFGSDKKTVGKFMQAVAATYDRDATKAREQITLAHERKASGKKLGLAASRATSTAMTIGGIAKWGRTVGDLTGASLASPFRYVMMGAMLAGRGAEAGKEVRLAGKEKTEFNQDLFDQIKNDIQPGYPSYSDEKIKQIVEQDQKEHLTLDLRKRLKKYEQPEKGYNLMQNLVRWDTARLVKKIRWEIVKIDGNKKISKEQKQEAKSKVLSKYADHLRDLDRMIDDYGKVDSIASLLKNTEFAAKVTVHALTVETLVLSASAMAESISNLIDKSNSLNVELGRIATGSIINTSEAGGATETMSGSAPEVVKYDVTLAGQSQFEAEIPKSVSSLATEMPITPASEVLQLIDPLTEFKSSHALYEATGAQVTEGVNGIKVEYEIGAKGDFNTLDQALRRVVASEINIGADNKFDAVDATRAENVTANLRVLLEGKSVAGIKPEELQGIAEYKDGKLTIIDYDKFKSFVDDKLFDRATTNITEANLATGYDRTSVAKWQEMMDQRTGAPRVDFGVAEQAAPKIETTPSPIVESAPKAPVLESISPVESRGLPQLKTIEIDTTKNLGDYLGGVVEKLSVQDSTQLVDTIRQAKLDGADWHLIERVVGKDVDLLRDADGTFSAEQMTKAMELIRSDNVSPERIKMVLEVMHNLDFKHAAEEKSLVGAIVDYSKNSDKSIHHLEKIFGTGQARNAQVSLNENKGILKFSNIGKDKLDGWINFREGKMKVGGPIIRLFNKKIDLKSISEIAR